MKRKFTKLMAALALLVFMTPSLAGWGQTRDESVTMKYSGSTTNMTGSNDAELVGLDDDDWSVVGDCGGHTYYPGLNTDGTIRLYYHEDGSNTITVTNLNNYTITSIVVTYKSSSYNGGTITVGGEQVSNSGTNDTDTEKTYEINATSFVIGNGGTSQVRINSVDIYYSTSGSSSYTVTYKANGGTGDNIVDDNGGQGYASGAIVNVLDNTFTRTGYDFTSWNTKADGSGDTYYGQSSANTPKSFEITSNTILHAQWTVHTHNITMPVNDAYGTYAMNKTNPVAYGTEVTLTYTPESSYASYEATWSINGTPISGNKFNMPDTDVTVTVSLSYVQWVETTLANLTPADAFVIVGKVGDDYYALPNNGGSSSSPSLVSVNVENGTPKTLSGSIAESIQWNLSGNSTAGYTFYPKGTATTWLYCNTTSSSSNNNNIRVGTGTSNSNRNVFELTSANKLITKDSYTVRYLSTYISGATADWRGYTGDGSAPAITFYKKVTANVSYDKEITGYNGSDGGYYLIASPVASVTPSGENGFVAAAEEDYDLYYFDQSKDDEWRNFKASNFNLASGKGYLYASNETTTLTFEGQPYNGNGLFTLDSVPNTEFAGWNLIGNPFTRTTTLNKVFYRMNTDGNGFVSATEGSEVAAMEGVFVKGKANTTAIFTIKNSKGGKNGIAMMEITLSQGSIVDNAIVRFDEGETLEKFMLRADGTKLYFTENNKDYAIVRSNGQNEMPLNFYASANGTYTLSVNAENVEMNYLHLIDNMTGTDVDLLATPSYSFEAKTSDYASRFRLVFSANSVEEQSAEAFAFFNGDSWTVSNQGEATLQVIDMMGRVLSSETLNGNANVNLNQTAGIYMLRLVNGNDVKVQKVVVR